MVAVLHVTDQFGNKLREDNVADRIQQVEGSNLTESPEFYLNSSRLLSLFYLALLSLFLLNLMCLLLWD